MEKTLLPDINLWLALSFDAHSHHRSAVQWFDLLAEEVCYFCRLTQQGFLRLATNPSVFQGDALSMSEAWEKFDLLMSDPRVAYSEEPVALETHWRSFTDRQSYSPKVWNDAYLAAFALFGGVELVTFDRGMLQYRPAACRILR